MLNADVLAHRVYGRVCCSEARPRGPGWILKKLVGAEHLFFLDAPLSVRPVPIDALDVTIPAGLGREAEVLALATAVVRAFGYLEPPASPWSKREVERAARAIVMPERALRAFVRKRGPRATDIAQHFHVSPSVADQRLQSLHVPR